jgi:cytochrome c oxidase subunit 2
MAELTWKKRTAIERQAKKKRQQAKLVIFLGISVIVLSTAGFLLYKAFYIPPLPDAANVIDLTADMSGFNQKEIRVKVGEPVTVRLRSLDNSHHTDGGGQHQWAVDELGVSIIAPPEGVSKATFTPTKPGEYVFFCDICCGGKANPTMNGKIIVEG